jgi:hypothetical protein
VIFEIKKESPENVFLFEHTIGCIKAQGTRALLPYLPTALTGRSLPTCLFFTELTHTHCTKHLVQLVSCVRPDGLPGRLCGTGLAGSLEAISGL